MGRIFVLISLIALLSGCAAGPPVTGLTSGSTQMGDRVGLYGGVKERIHFLIIAGKDAKPGGHGVSYIPLRGARWTGAIKPAAEVAEIPYRAGWRKMRIGDQKFDLARGRVFLLSTTGGKTEIRQTDMPFRDQVKAVMASEAHHL